MRRQSSTKARISSTPTAPFRIISVSVNLGYIIPSDSSLRKYICVCGVDSCKLFLANNTSNPDRLAKKLSYDQTIFLKESKRMDTVSGETALLDICIPIVLSVSPWN